MRNQHRLVRIDTRSVRRTQTGPYVLAFQVNSAPRVLSPRLEYVARLVVGADHQIWKRLQARKHTTERAPEPKKLDLAPRGGVAYSTPTHRDARSVFPVRG